MKLARTRSELEACLGELDSEDLGLVPTMGALHEGHLSLCLQSKAESRFTAMSIFVNPTQFGPQEDYSKYPRTLESDLIKAKEAGVDVVFAPLAEEMYSDLESICVQENLISKELCGRFRPGHFDGVCTVVLKLLQLFQPRRAYFGLKDAQQFRVLEKMTEDLFLPTELVPCETVRETDGLAKSSRNQYLSAEERQRAPKLFKALSRARNAFQRGERNSEKLVRLAKDCLEEDKALEIQYLELRRWKDFSEVDEVRDKALLAAAVFVGKTRLIDNVILQSGN